MADWLPDRTTTVVQTDDNVSDYVDVSFGVPQGSILGPVMFNIYVNDLSDNLDSNKSYQYADDTTIYIHEKPANLKAGEEKLQKALDRLASWSSSCNLSLNAKKTKVVLSSTKQLSRVHELDAYPTNLSAGGTKLKRLTSTKLLGTTFQENLKWNEDIQSKISCSYYCRLDQRDKTRQRCCYFPRKDEGSMGGRDEINAPGSAKKNIHLIEEL